MTEHADVVIVGAGQAGALAAITLRQQKHTGSILVLGAEPELPYERPALTKEYLAGDKAFDKLLLRPAAFWEERAIAFRLGARVVSVDAARREVGLEGGGAVGYGALVWAAGGRPRKLACGGHELAGVHYVRDRADVDRLRDELPGARRVVVVGGGYIGLEAASVLRKKDKEVTVLEAEARLLARVAGDDLAGFFAREHRARGVDVRLGAKVVGLEGDGGRVTGVRLDGGALLPADVVVVGIGIEAAVEPLLAAGAEGGDGVHVDLQGRTSLPGVYAIGDCAAHANVHARGARIRLESIQNANDQALVAAKAIAGTLAEGERYDQLPWFWSNQYELKLQTVGLFHGHDDVVVRGDPDARSFSVVYLREGRVVALDCVNLTKDYVQGRALVAGGRVVDRARLARADVTLKELAAEG